MFADACAKAKHYARPVIEVMRTVDGSITSSVGTFIIINREGWVISSGHIFDSFVRFQTDQRKLKELNDMRESNPGAEVMDPAPDTIRNHSLWWGWDGVFLNDVTVYRQLDLSIGRLMNFNPSMVDEYPVLGDPDRTRCGMSLCRLGYPFMHFDTGFDEKLNAFKISRVNSSEMIFPNECMCTRHIRKGRSKDGKVDLDYIETSTPGLRGQSGGPIVDVKGFLRAMQVSTASFPLDFHPVANYNGQQVVESQFLNVGLGVDVSVIRKLLDERNIRYSYEGDDAEYRIIS